MSISKAFKVYSLKAIAEVQIYWISCERWINDVSKFLIAGFEKFVLFDYKKSFTFTYIKCLVWRFWTFYSKNYNAIPIVAINSAHFKVQVCQENILNNTSQLSITDLHCYM